jgi:uncharacterized protein (DUF488 family)
MENSTIYSIGHGNKEIEKFIEELKSFDIQFLVDVRTSPYSKWNSQFNRELLEISMKQAGVKYAYMGDDLGGLPSDRSCYDENDKVVYDLIKAKEFFRRGLERIINANEQKHRVAMMCSESKPEECHRSKLIGQELLDQGIVVNHIVAKSKLKSQQRVMNELTKGKGTTDLFGNDIDLKSRKSY